MEQTASTEPPVFFALPIRAGSAVDDPLPQFLQAHHERSLILDAAELRRMDLPLLQLLLLAAQDWRARGLGFALSGLSADQGKWLALLGIGEDLLPRGGEA